MSISNQIITELQQGRFNPIDHIMNDPVKFEGWESWTLTTFEMPADKKGLFDLEALLRSINDLKKQIDTIVRNQNIAVADKELAIKKAFAEKIQSRSRGRIETGPKPGRNGECLPLGHCMDPGAERVVGFEG